MAGFYVIRQTQTRIPGGGDNEPVICETYDSEADFVKSLIEYYEHLIAELKCRTTYFEDEDGIDALNEIREHMANLAIHIATDKTTFLKPEEYGFKGLWWYWINVYVATDKLEEYEEYMRVNPCTNYD